jgi:hypothetical protein
MSLRNILRIVAPKIGADLENQQQLDFVIQEINRAALDEYTAKDFPNSLVQQRFFMTNDTDLVRSVLPYYVGKVRAMRYSDLSGATVNMTDMRPRYYNGNSWTNSTNYLKFEIQSDATPLKQEVTNASRFQVVLKKVETQDVIVTAAGRTTFAGEYSESVTVPAGSLSAWSVGNFEDYTTITKDVITDADVEIKDVDGTVISEIINYAGEARYTIAQVSTKLATQILLQPGYTRTLEVLYKRKFRPMTKLTDEFMCPDCDDIISWAYLSEYMAAQEGQEQRALLANAKKNELAADLALDDESGKLMQAEFLKGSGLRGFNSIRQNRRGMGWRIR